MKIIKKEKVDHLKEMVNKAEGQVFNASTPGELATSVIVLTKTKQAITEAKAKLKEIEAEPKSYIKEMSLDFERLDAAIKDKFLETYKEETLVTSKNNQTTGEVTFKETKLTNKGNKMFTFKPSKTKLVLDMDKITFETHPHLFKEIIKYELDMDALNKLDPATLPQKEVQTKASVGIQWKQVENTIKELENGE